MEVDYKAKYGHNDNHHKFTTGKGARLSRLLRFRQ